MVGAMPEEMKVIKLWYSLNSRTQHAMWRDGLHPDSSSWDEVVAKAEIIEIADSVVDRQDESGRNTWRLNISDSSYRRSHDSDSASQSLEVEHKNQYRDDSRRAHHSNQGDSSALRSSGPGLEDSRSTQRKTVKFADLSEITQLMTEGRCFNCKEIGHISRNCPHKSTVKGDHGSDTVTTGVPSYGMNMTLLDDVDDDNDVLEYMPVGFMDLDDANCNAEQESSSSNDDESDDGSPGKVTVDFGRNNFESDDDNHAPTIPRNGVGAETRTSCRKTYHMEDEFVLCDPKDRTEGEKGSGKRLTTPFTATNWQQSTDTDHVNVDHHNIDKVHIDRDQNQFDDQSIMESEPNSETSAVNLEIVQNDADLFELQGHLSLGKGKPPPKDFLRTMSVCPPPLPPESPRHSYPPNPASPSQHVHITPFSPRILDIFDVFYFLIPIPSFFLIFLHLASRLSTHGDTSELFHDYFGRYFFDMPEGIRVIVRHWHPRNKTEYVIINHKTLHRGILELQPLNVDQMSNFLTFDKSLRIREGKTRLEPTQTSQPTPKPPATCVPTEITEIPVACAIYYIAEPLADSRSDTTSTIPGFIASIANLPIRAEDDSDS